jgi:hypothetical protein
MVAAADLAQLEPEALDEPPHVAECDVGHRAPSEPDEELLLDPYESR